MCFDALIHSISSDFSFYDYDSQLIKIQNFIYLKNVLHVEDHM